MYAHQKIHVPRLLRGIGQIMLLIGLLIVAAGFIFFYNHNIKSYDEYYNYLIIAGEIILIFSFVLNLIALKKIKKQSDI